MICGIDEAGRGPVLGPMVMAGVLIDETKIKKLRDMGVRDSKQLNSKEREILYKKILGIVEKYKIISISPEEIDFHLKDSTLSLNILEARITSKILNALSPKKAFIDLPDRNKLRYETYIKQKLNNTVELICEYKADYKYPVVSAASILAKVTRDKYIEQLQDWIGEDFGSGYPSDPKTIAFLEKHWNNPSITFIRREWASWKNIKFDKEQKRLSEY